MNWSRRDYCWRERNWICPKFPKLIPTLDTTWGLIRVSTGTLFTGIKFEFGCSKSINMKCSNHTNKVRGNSYHFSSNMHLGWGILKVLKLLFLLFNAMSLHSLTIKNPIINFYELRYTRMYLRTYVGTIYATFLRSAKQLPSRII